MSLFRSRVIAGRYELRVPLGEGTFSITWRATDTVLGRDVAIKVLREQYSNHPTFAARFDYEARAAALISHPNVVPVFDFGADGDLRYIVMQYVPGPTLKEYIRDEGRLPIDEAISITRQILEGLAAIHDAGIIHRDVKPQNVLLTETRQPKLTDFGIARSITESNLTGTGTAIGTAAYMAPEQAAGDEVGPETDLYSVGVILYEMLTGRLPFPGDNPVQVMYRHVNELPQPPRSINRQIPLTLEAFVLRALSKNPSDRYPDARTMRDALLNPAAEPTIVVPRAQRAATPVAPAMQPALHVAGGAHTGAIPIAAGARPPRATRARRATNPLAIIVPALALAAMIGAVAFFAFAGGGGDGSGADPTATLPVVVGTDTPSGEATPTSGPTEEPAATPTQEPTPEPTATPTATLAPTATTTPTATATASPTASPTPTATATSTPEPTATIPPTPTQQSGIPPNTPFPAAGLPASVLQGPASVFGPDAFDGALRVDDDVLGQPASMLFGPGSGYDVATVTFVVDEQPDNYVVIVLRGMDDDPGRATELRLWLNDVIIWEGDSPFRDGQWFDVGWLVGDVAWLHAGENTLTIELLSDDDDHEIGEPPWLGLSDSAVYYD